ncbi:MAG: DUF11 domain-containing protein, partial [Caldilineaceae bacterium]
MRRTLPHTLPTRPSRARRLFVLLLLLALVGAALFESSQTARASAEETEVVLNTSTNILTITDINDISPTNNSSLTGVSVTCVNALTVQNTADSGAGSLRQAVADLCDDGVIDFAAGLSGQTITLTTGEIALNQTATITGSVPITISGNNASRIFSISSSGVVTLSHLTLLNGNAVNDNGGAIESNGDLTIESSTLANNQATYAGGAIRVNTGTTRLYNSTISGNTSGTYGGGVRNNSGTLFVVHTTFIDNFENGSGGANIDNSGTLHLTNSLLSSSDTSKDCDNVGGTIATNINNLIEDGTCSAAFSGDPKVSPLADNGGQTFTHALLAGSPAINEADASNCRSADQRDVARPQGGGCDIGAFELIPADLSLTKTVDPANAQPGEPITYTLAFTNSGPAIAINVILSDSIPVSVTISGVASSSYGGASIVQTSGSPDFAWDVSDLAVDAGGWITLTGTLNAGLSVQNIANTATITASNDITSTNNSVSVSLHVNGILYVDTDASGSATGVSWTDAFTNVQDALALAASGDEIWVAAGVYYPDEGNGQTDDNRSASFQLTSGMGLYGGFAGGETSRAQRASADNLTVLSGDIDHATNPDTATAQGVVTDTANIAGNNAYHVVIGSGTDSSAVLDGFTVTAGQANGSEYSEHFGGGLYSYDGTPTVSNVTFSANSASVDGGGLYSLISSGSPMLTNVTFSGNSTGGDGGGIYNRGGSPMLTNVTFSGNSVGSQGGGFFSHFSNPTLINVTFSGNRASDGGGMNSYRGGLSLTNVTFSGNSASGDGGGLYNYKNDTYGSPTFTNVIFWGNRAGTSLFNQMITRNDNFNPTISHSIVEGGCASIAFGANCGTGNLDVDPRFVSSVDAGSAPTTEGDLRLQVDSPAIDVGDNSANSSSTDPDGNPRIVNGSIDIGAYEFQSSDLAVAKAVDPASTQPGATITYTLSFTNTGPTAGENVIISDSVPVSVTVTGVTSSTVGGANITQTSGSPDFAWDVSDLAVGAGGHITLTGT